MSLLTAQVDFIDEYVNVIYIPLKRYSEYLQPILQLLCPVTPHGSAVEDTSFPTGLEMDEKSPWSNQHPFLNISITPIECTIICTISLAEKFFVPAIDRINRLYRNDGDRASIATDDYVIFSVVAASLDAGQRVLELTSPLAMIGISIFFITTYFSDYILVPVRARGQVIRALEQRGFVFERDPATDVDMAGQLHEIPPNSSSSSEFRSALGDQPPSSAAELEGRTFKLLTVHGIAPEVNREIRLVHCAGRRGSPGRHLPQDSELRIGLMQCLIHQPRFLSLTLTQTESASLLLQHKALANFGSDDILLGVKDVILIPIMLNLQSLPIEAPGIICGVAGKLKDVPTGRVDRAMEMSYLSTARTGTVMVEERDLGKAVKALREGEFGFNVS